MNSLFTPTTSLNRICAYLISSVLVASMGAGLPAFGQVSFAPTVNYASGGRGGYLSAIGDVTGDGYVDIVTANNFTNLFGGTVTVLAGNGKGTFKTATAYNTLSKPYGIALGDFDKDGRLDIATSNSDDSITLLLANSSGGFAAPTQYSTGDLTQPQGLAVGDLNNDGSLDIVTPNFRPNTVSILVNDKQGHFSTGRTSYSTGTATQPQAVALGDVNGDGKLDVITTATPLDLMPYPNAISVLLNDGTGKLGAATLYSCGSNAEVPNSIAVGDVNGDGKLDVVTGNFLSGSVSVLLNTGAGAFATGITYSGRLGSEDEISIALGDVSGDGKLDIVVPIQNRNLIKILVNNGNGTFTSQTTTYATGESPMSAVATDLNADGAIDIVTSNTLTNNISVLLNTGKGVLAAISTTEPLGTALYPNPTHTSTTLVVPSVPGATQASIYLYDAVGHLVRTQLAPVGKPYELNVGDMDKGFYLLRLVAGETSLTRRLVID